MPPDISEKEKVIGGLLTLGQGLWIALGIGLYLGSGALLHFIFGYFSFVISIPWIIAGAVFALKRKYEMDLFTYLKYKYKYKKKNKFLPNKRIYKGGD